MTSKKINLNHVYNIRFKEMEKAKCEYQDLQKTMQQIATKNTNEKSKLEKYKLITLYFTMSTSFY